MENSTKQTEKQTMDPSTIEMTNRAIVRFEQMMYEFMSDDSKMHAVILEIADAADECDKHADKKGNPESYNPLSSKLMMIFVREFHRKTMTIIREEFHELLIGLEREQQFAFVRETMFFFLDKSGELLSKEVSRRIEAMRD